MCQFTSLLTEHFDWNKCMKPITITIDENKTGNARKQRKHLPDS